MREPRHGRRRACLPFGGSAEGHRYIGAAEATDPTLVIGVDEFNRFSLKKRAGLDD